MKIKLWSDIHLEFSKHAFSHILVPNPEHKEMTLVLAGDIDVGPFGQAFIDAACAEFKYVLRVFGNHEFYSQQFDEVIADWTKYELEGPKNFHLLHNDTRYLDGVRFIGGTMWTSFDNNNPLVVMEAMRLVSSGRYGDIPRRRMSDYEEIWNDGKVITPEFTTGDIISSSIFYSRRQTSHLTAQQLSLHITVPAMLSSDLDGHRTYSTIVIMRI
jgi:hypothetical protein